MDSEWVHWHDIKRPCPICGEPTHVAKSTVTKKVAWLHDHSQDISLFYKRHGRNALPTATLDEVLQAISCDRPDAVPESAPEDGDTSRVINCRPVICRESGTVFPSIKAAAQEANISRSCISNAIRRGGTAADLHWDYA